MGNIIFEESMNIPKDGRRRGSKYPFEKLEIGSDTCFTVPASKAKKASVRAAAMNYNKRTEQKARFKIVEFPEEAVVRVWRIS